MWLVAPITFGLVLAIAYISAQFAVRIQYVIMAIIGLSLVQRGFWAVSHRRRRRASSTNRR